MNIRAVFRRAFVAAALLSLVARLPEARAEYGNGSFMGVFGTAPVGTGSFTMPNGALFPQVTTGDYGPADGDNHAVSVATGMTLDFYLTIGELAGDVVTGKMRFTNLQLETPGDTRLLILGTYTLSLGNDGGPYEISGPVVGDRYTLYLPGRDTNGTLADATDDSWFLLKINHEAVGPDPDHPAYLTARAQLLMGNKVLASKVETYATDTAPGGGGTFADFDAPGLPSGATFNQIRSADFELLADTPARFASGRVRTGTIPVGGDPITFIGNNIFLTDGGTPVTTGKGLFVNRFTRTLPGGKTMEGFTVGDVDAAIAGGMLPFQGYVFGFATGQPAPAILYGTVDNGLADAAAASGQFTTDLVAVDPVPPEAPPLGYQRDLFADRFTPYDTYGFDFNGWQDVTSVQLLINDTTASNRILARYDAVKNRLSLFNKATNKWVGSCLPGSAGLIKTPYVTLDCAATGASRRGEIVYVNWSLKPSARMLPPLKTNVYVKVTDRAGLIAGWRMIRSGQSITAVGPPPPP